MPEDTPSLFGPEGDQSPRPSRRARPSLSPRARELSSLASKLPRGLHLGTSSWSFPGWRGLVWDAEASETTLSREGLRAYGTHPLFRTVGIDKTYYRPAPRADFERLASQVPDGFRFLTKMWRGAMEDDARTSSNANTPSTALDARVATIDCILPAIEGLGRKAGPLLFQFSPSNYANPRARANFFQRLDAFLGALPTLDANGSAFYAIEVRDRNLVEAEFGELLARHRVTPCLTVHPSMPTLREQSQVLALDPMRPLVMRWMLRGNLAYSEAKDLYAPFDKLVEADDPSRDDLAMLAAAALQAGLGAWIVVNNKAEGCAPLSVERVARCLAARLEK